MLGSCGFMDIGDHTVFQQSQGQHTFSVTLKSTKESVHFYYYEQHYICLLSFLY